MEIRAINIDQLMNMLSQSEEQDFGKEIEVYSDLPMLIETSASAAIVRWDDLGSAIQLSFVGNKTIPENGLQTIKLSPASADEIKSFLQTVGGIRFKTINDWFDSDEYVYNKPALYAQKVKQYKEEGNKE